MPNSAISFNTSGLATATSPGLVGTGAQTFGGAKTFQNGLVFTSASLSDSQATMMGLKQYLHGTTYNGGNAPTVGGVTSVTKGVFIPYQMQDGSWRLKFNIYCNPGGASATATVNGITFTTYQAGCAHDPSNNNTWSFAGCINNTNQISIRSGTSTGALSFSGDVEITSKPTWAY